MQHLPTAGSPCSPFSRSKAEEGSFVDRGPSTRCWYGIVGYKSRHDTDLHPRGPLSASYCSCTRRGQHRDSGAAGHTDFFKADIIQEHAYLGEDSVLSGLLYVWQKWGCHNVRVLGSVQVKTEATDGYNAVQVGYQVVEERKITKPELNHLKKFGAPPMKQLREYRVRLLHFEGLRALHLAESERQGPIIPKNNKMVH